MLEEVDREEKTTAPRRGRKEPPPLPPPPPPSNTPMSIGVRIDKSIRDKSVDFENATYRHFGKKVGFSKQVRIALNIFYAIPFDFTALDPDDDAETLLMRQALSILTRNGR
jgi:hypothetical protein